MIIYAAITQAGAYIIYISLRCWFPTREEKEGEKDNPFFDLWAFKPTILGQNILFYVKIGKIPPLALTLQCRSKNKQYNNILKQLKKMWTNNTLHLTK